MLLQTLPSLEKERQANALLVLVVCAAALGTQIRSQGNKGHCSVLPAMLPVCHAQAGNTGVKTINCKQIHSLTRMTNTQFNYFLLLCRQKTKATLNLCKMVRLHGQVSHMETVTETLVTNDTETQQKSNYFRVTRKHREINLHWKI